MTVSKIYEQFLLSGTVHRATEDNNMTSKTLSSSHVDNTFNITRPLLSSRTFKEPIIKVVRGSTLTFIFPIGSWELSFILSLRRSVCEMHEDVGAFDSLVLSRLPFPSFQVDSLGVTGEDVVYEGDEVDE